MVWYLAIMSALPRVYLAGPDVFRPNAEERGAELKDICRKHGLEGVYPLDHAPQSDDPEKIRAHCIALICDFKAVVADISPFRGIHMDPGTAFEIGYAAACNREIFLWSGDARSLVERVSAIGRVRGDESDNFRDERGYLIDNQPENLMITYGQIVHDSAEHAIEQAALYLHR